ncbi:MAG: cytochrome c biogenesis protein CcdA [Chloroflexi bacterium]|nr:cytochrome c biogenesis protein CcdA [Chloroflexota bacterium]
MPFGYAFGAGMVTTASPCGVAMLPAYVSFYLEAREGSFWTQSPLRRGSRALAMSGMVTLGFVLFFGLMGVVLSAGGQFLTRFFPWVAVIIGASLIVLGLLLLFGKHVHFNLVQRVTGRFASSGSGFGFLVFGMVYAMTALSCTLPVFLAVVGSALSSQDFAYSLFQFISFALGMGFILTIVTIGSAIFKEGVSRWVERLVPVIDRLSGVLLILAGSYILYFWFKVGGLLGTVFK